VAYVAWKSGRTVAGVLVIAAHIALILLLSRPAHQAPEIVEVLLLPLPITLVSTVPDTSSNTTEQQRATNARRARREPPTARASSPSTIVDTPGAAISNVPPNESPNAAESPIPQIDWHAELTTAARSAEQRARIDSERRTLSGLAQTPMKLPAKKLTCPFERCEPGWDSPPGIFPHSKAGRVEKSSDGEVIRWTSERCYQTLVSNDIFHRAMTRCQVPFEKSKARGDLFDHMRDVPPPTEKALDVP
jgi:hypothetical protein